MPKISNLNEISQTEKNNRQRLRIMRSEVRILSGVLLKSITERLASSKTSFGKIEGPALKLCITDFIDSIMIADFEAQR